MKVSLNCLKKYVDIPASVSTDELVKLIGSRLVEVEEVIDLKPKYEGVYVVKVVECEAIPDTHLHLCKIDAGAVGAEVAKNGKTPSDDGYVQVVCGAPNVHKGMLTAWITPGAIVPQTFGNEDFKLSVRKLRGYESYGMLAAADELDLGASHDGIVELAPHAFAPGTSFLDAFDLDDKILDIENKSLTHRPDTFGLIGFAREVAGILGLKFHEPALGEVAQTPLVNAASAPVEIRIDDLELCPRYACAVVDFAKLPQANSYFTTNDVFLAKAGMRAISPIVDLTNILMLETGQPLHAFDYDKFVAAGQSQTPQIVVRAAQDGEALQLLDGKTIACNSNDILVCSGNTPVALAGAMGGANTEIDASTTKVIFESASFSLYHLRKTQMAHGIFSEAITRFTKGQPAALALPVLKETLVRLGDFASNAKVLNLVDQYPSPTPVNVVKTTTDRINRLLGSDYDTSTIKTTLENVGFQVAVASDQKSLTVTAPYWRTDIHIPEDVTEEVGRLLGYDNLALDFPRRSLKEAPQNPLFSFKTSLRQLLSCDFGAHEVLTYSFVSKNLQARVGEDPADSYEIVNSISPALQCFRQSLVPSLLDKIRANLKSGHRDFTLYELNQVSKKSFGLTPEKTPITKTHLALTTFGDFYAIKAIFEQLAQKLGRELSLRPLQDAKVYPYLEPAHAVEVCSGEAPIGALGEVKARVLKQFKLDQTPLAALELDLEVLLSAPQSTKKSFNLSKFPPVHRDLTFEVPAATAFAQLEQALDAALTQACADKSISVAVTPVSVYQKSPEAKTKNLSFALTFTASDHTLVAAEISDIIDLITKSAAPLDARLV